MKCTFNSSIRRGKEEVDTARGGTEDGPAMDSPTPPKSFYLKLCERAAASRFLTASVLIHLVIIIVGGSVVWITQIDPKKNDEFTTTGPVVNAEQEKAPPTDEVKPIVEMPQPAPEIAPPSIPKQPASAPVTDPGRTFGSRNPIDQTIIATTKPSGPKISSGQIGHLNGTENRIGDEARKGSITKHGGKPASDDAVLRGLRWLQKNQNTDGSWSTQHQAAMTGFGLLSFLGHGELPASREFGKTVGQALDWVLENGKKNGGRLSMESAIGQQGAYAHGIVTYALGEYCLLTECRDEPAVELFRQAVQHIVDGQGADGGWMYHFSKTQSDTSVSGWQMQALKVARLSGLKIAGADEALEKAMQNLKRVQGPGGGFGYRKAEDKYSLTGIGVLCSSYAQDPKDMEKRIDRGVEFMMAQLEANPVKYEHPTANLYAWYYNTQACLMVGAESRDAKLRKAWTEWNGRFAGELLKSQAADGSWPPMAASGVEKLQQDAEGAGQFYRTNLSILMLEVYYRYTPALRRAAEKNSHPAKFQG